MSAPLIPFILLLLSMHAMATPPAAPPATPPLPSGGQLVGRFIHAIGGDAAIQGIQELTARGHIALPESNDTGTFVWQVADQNRCRFETSFPGLGSSSFGSDGHTGWESVSIGEAEHTTELSLIEVDQRRRRANWFELALTLPARAKEFTTVGAAQFDGAQTWEVRMVDSNDRVQKLFFDQDSHLLSAVRVVNGGTSGRADVTIRFSEWRPVGPIKLFHEVSIDHAGLTLQLHIDSVSLEPIPAQIFTPPTINARSQTP